MVCTSFHQEKASVIFFVHKNKLIANKIFVIHEEINEEENLYGIKKNLTFVPYNNMVTKTLELLKDPKFDEIVNKQYDYFKTYWNINKFILY